MEMIGNILGLTGTALFLIAYFMLQKGKWGPHSIIYLAINLAGAVLLVSSLLIDWNLSAFLLEAAWGLISMWGLVKAYQSRTR